MLNIHSVIALVIVIRIAILIYGTINVTIRISNYELWLPHQLSLECDYYYDYEHEYKHHNDNDYEYGYQCLNLILNVNIEYEITTLIPIVHSHSPIVIEYHQ